MTNLADGIRTAAEALARAHKVVVLSGAGMSAESGVPTFRGAGGLWREHRPEDLATPAAFTRDPALVWDWYRWRRAIIAQARPNPGHETLARLEARFPGLTVLTQNVDGLHARAGSRRVLELHGSIWQSVCEHRCGGRVDDAPWMAGRAPSPAQTEGVPRCRCGARLRPGVVWFGEPLDEDTMAQAFSAASGADAMIVVGTSALVQPAASLPIATWIAGGTVIEVNIDETPVTELARHVLSGPAGEVLPALEAAL